MNRSFWIVISSCRSSGSMLPKVCMIPNGMECSEEDYIVVGCAHGQPLRCNRMRDARTQILLHVSASHTTLPVSCLIKEGKPVPCVKFLIQERARARSDQWPSRALPVLSGLLRLGRGVILIKRQSRAHYMNHFRIGESKTLVIYAY